MLEPLIVAAVVLAAFVYAAWSLLPTPARLRIARALGRAADRGSAGPWLGRLASRLERTASRRGSACSGCDAGQAATGRHPPSGRG